MGIDPSYLPLNLKGDNVMKEQFFVGIDIAKRLHKAAIIDNNGSLIKNLSIRNLKIDIDLFVQTMTNIAPIDNFIIGMESTGHYWFVIYHSLKNLGFNTVAINPAQTKAFSKIRIRKTKTDKLDAKSIAQLLRFGGYSITTVPNEECFRLRELSRFRHKLIELTSTLKLKLTSLLDVSFPEFETAFPRLSLKTTLAFLEKFPSPSRIINAKTETIAQLLYQSSKHRWNLDKAKTVKELAHNSFGLCLAEDISNLEISSLITLIKAFKSRISIIEEETAKIMDKIHSPITTIKGIGPITGASILGEIADISRFNSPKQLVAFCGLDPSVCQSGEFQGTRMKISKRGSNLLRHSIWQAAVSARRFNKTLSAYYEKKKKEGKHTNVATVAVARKLVCVIWRIMKDNRPYEE